MTMYAVVEMASGRAETITTTEGKALNWIIAFLEKYNFQFDEAKRCLDDLIVEAHAKDWDFTVKFRVCRVEEWTP